MQRTQAKAFVGLNPPLSLANNMHHEWIKFAKTGKASWMPYQLETRPTMIFDAKSAVKNDPKKATRKLWENKPY